MARHKSDGDALPERNLKALYELLVELFEGGGLHRWAHYALGAKVAAELPAPNADLATLAHKVAVLAKSHGRLDAALFKALEDERPGQTERIREVATLFEGESSKATRAPSEPSYPDAETRALSTELSATYQRRDTLLRLGQDTTAVTEEILALRRRIREGGRLKPGDFLGDGRYVLIDVLGRGGFATVWRAMDTQSGRTEAGGPIADDDAATVAIKVMHTHLVSEASRFERFFRGARIMATLRHEAIVRVLEPHAEDGGYHYFVMELVPGGTLRQAVIDGRVTPDKALPVVLAIGDAVAAAHGAGLIHRDIKPDNVLMRADGRPALTDFDLVGAADTTGGTRTGAMGTFLYAAPEMLDRPQDADARADVYGLGMTAIFALHGDKLPRFVLRNAGPVIAKLPCSEAVKRVLARAVDWDVDVRYPNASTLCEALREATRKDSPSPVPRRERRRRQSPAPREPSTALSRTERPAPAAEPPQIAHIALGVIAPMRFVELPGGAFTMGSPDDEAGRYDHEGPQHRVQLSPFLIAEHQVTQAQWQEIMGSNPSHRFASGHGGAFPVQSISWLDAIEFLNRLSQREGLTPCYEVDGERVRWDRSRDGYRLPTEAEWEYACRAGSSSAFGAGVDVSKLGEYARYGKGVDDGPIEVGSLKPNAWGLHDMHGNVWEWTWDWFGSYKRDAQSDPEGPENGEYRTLRGGSFDGTARNLRCANRVRFVPGLRYWSFGLRVVRGAGRQP